MQLTAVLIPDGSDGFTVMLPALPGCLSEGDTRAEALQNVQEAALGWLDVEQEAGRGPLDETTDLLADAARDALQILSDMREAGELPASAGFSLELVPIELASRAGV